MPPYKNSIPIENRLQPTPKTTPRQDAKVVLQVLTPQYWTRRSTSGSARCFRTGTKLGVGWLCAIEDHDSGEDCCTRQVHEDADCYSTNVWRQ